MKIIELKNVNKKFILHNQKGTVLNVLKNINLEIKTGECIALVGKSGIGNLISSPYPSLFKALSTIEIAIDFLSLYPNVKP